jgi:hypothetical protein
MRKTALALLTVTVVTTLVYAQTESKPNLSQEYIEILGVKVRLGMSKADIAEKLGSQKMKDSRDDFWLLGEKQEWPSSVEFKDGRVIYASQSWMGADKDTARALFGVVSTLNRQGYAACELSADTQTTPNLTVERVWIVCGRKSILVQRLQGSKDNSTFQQVFERLGSPSPDIE